MKRDILIIAAAFMLFFACKRIFNSVKGTGPVETETRSLKDFKGVELGASADVYMTQATDFKVTIEAQKNIAELLETNVEGGILKIYFKKSTGNVNYEKLIIHVEAPLFESIYLLGSGNMIAQNAFKGDKLSLNITGSGDVRVKDATYNAVKAELSGSGNLEVGGSAESSELEVSGSGDLEAGDLKSKKVEASITGSGNIDCQAETSMDASVTGSGDIHYKGNPSVKSRITGSGSIDKK